MANWLVGPPSATQVAEHARKYPQGSVGIYGMWMVCYADAAWSAGIIFMRYDPDFIGKISSFGVPPPSTARYLPLTREGLPVDYAELQADNARMRQVISARIDKCRVEWEREISLRTFFTDHDKACRRCADLRAALKGLEKKR